MNESKRIRRWSFTAILLVIIIMALSPAALADTNGQELKVTDQPDRFVLELGSDWSGVQFELTTDAGIFPVPVVVNEHGILSMDLGGSKTYTLSRISEAPAQKTEPVSDDQKTPAQTESPIGENAGNDANEGIPTAQLVIFLCGLAIAVGGLIMMYIMKKRRTYYEYDEDEYDED